ncbi:hypothetical protein C3L29_003015 [Pseudomonas sp. MWU12-2534b]|nr:hypothetical protein C3L29_003015 [Pseudomonas sp. MWU12-2534b]
MHRTRTLPRLSTSPLLAVFFGLWAGTAQAASLSESLLDCQPGFFKALYQQRGELGQVVKLAENQRQGIAWVPVADRLNNYSASQVFSRPLNDGGLRLTGYYDRQFDLGEQGSFHFWGFEVDASRAAVMAALPQADWQEAGEYFISRPQIKLNAAAPWQDNPAAASGIAPAPGSAEKILMLSEEDGKTRLLCSLQGTIDQALFDQERPDLAQGAGR